MNLINYDDDPGHDPQNMSHGQLVMHWKALWYEHFEANAQWGIKETTLLSKLLKRYSGSQVAVIIEMYFKVRSNPPMPGPHLSFGHCFTAADNLWAQYTAERKEWQW